MKTLLIFILLFAMTLTSCAQKESMTVVKGDQGEKGAPGEPGLPGTGCTVTNLAADPLIAPYGGALLQCSENTVVISNGAPGADGLNAPPTLFSVVQKIDPCGDTPGKYDEILLRMADGSVIATISDNSSGLNTRLGDVPDGSWVTTDGTSCNFSVSTVGLNRSVNWSGGSASWTL